MPALEDRAIHDWSATGAGTNAGVTVVQPAFDPKVTPVCQHIEASGDAAALVTIESPAGTIVYRKRFTAAFTLSESIEVIGAVGQLMQGKISASTANCECNLDGYFILGA